MNLTQISVGDRVRITSLSEMNRLVRRRLIDLGIMEGTVVQIKKTLPFGGPYTIEACGQRIAIRKREAAQIWVEAA
ncbi:FeoA family protein [Gorillibacterium sp. sgz500922]|uniref:FeoA family protein n=1 Tax=Gorillibacterium sp. sgz500922 TaxID=3446694 RepID=UPI003F66DECB